MISRVRETGKRWGVLVAIAFGYIVAAAQDTPEGSGYTKEEIEQFLKEIFQHIGTGWEPPPELADWLLKTADEAARRGMQGVMTTIAVFLGLAFLTTFKLPRDPGVHKA